MLVPTTASNATAAAIAAASSIATVTAIAAVAAAERRAAAEIVAAVERAIAVAAEIAAVAAAAITAAVVAGSGVSNNRNDRDSNDVAVETTTMILWPSQLAANSRNSSGRNSRTEIPRNLAVAMTTSAIAAKSNWATVATAAPEAARKQQWK